MTSGPEVNENINQAVAVEIRDSADWISFAECRGEDPLTFDPRKVGEDLLRYAERLRRAEAICGRCAVLEQCQKAGSGDKHATCYRAGKTGPEQVAMAKSQARAIVRSSIASQQNDM